MLQWVNRLGKSGNNNRDGPLKSVAMQEIVSSSKPFESGADYLNQGEVDIYLFYPCASGNLEKSFDLHAFFAQLNKVKLALKEAAVFLNQATALQHSRFLSMPHVILHASVPHTGIVGGSDELRLKKGAWSQAVIRGYYPDWAEGHIYVSNPFVLGRAHFSS